MPQYRIDGADRATAIDRVITIEAESEVAAIEASNRSLFPLTASVEDFGDGRE